MHPWESKSGEELAPVVNPADIKTAWQVCHDSGLRNPGEQVAISMNVFEHFCSPGADIGSVTYRTVFLMMLLGRSRVSERSQAQKVLEWQDGDKLDERLAEVMARIPLKRLPKEGTHSSLPFDVNDFIRRAEEAA